jgi:hypothetical protein
MEIVEMILLAAGIILAFVGTILILINAFKESIWWGLGGLFVPFILPIYTFMRWEKNKTFFGIWFSGFLFYLGALIYFAEEGTFSKFHPFDS